MSVKSVKEEDHTQRAVYRGPFAKDPQYGRGYWRNTARGTTVATLSTVLANCQHTGVLWSTVMLLSCPTQHPG